MRNVFPLVRQASKSLSPSCGRGLWSLSRPPADIQRLMRDMDRRMEAFEKEFFKIAPFRYLQPHLMPIEGINSGKNFQVDVDATGFQPEDIKISFKDGKLRVEAKMDKTSENGNRVQQHLIREFTVPENVDEKTVQSFLHSNGILTIEAAEKPGGTKIPISGPETSKCEVPK